MIGFSNGLTVSIGRPGIQFIGGRDNPYPAWSQQADVTIDNTGNANTLTDYQVKLTVSYDANMQADFADIRFADGNVPLPYWMESKTDSTEAVFWINVPSVPASDTKTIQMYYGNANATSESDGDAVFIFFDDTFDAIVENGVDEAVLTNAATYQTTPTYDGSGQAVHPDVVYFADGWNGYNYWMALTPYPNTQDSFENPSILASNDGASWEVPAGLTNPIAPKPPCDHNSDTELIYNPDTDELWLYYLDTRRANRCEAQSAEDYYNHNMVQLYKSSDGVTWTGPTTVLDFDLSTDPLYVSPTVVLKDGTYYLWMANANNAADVKRWSSADGVTWESPTAITLGENVWHLNVNYIASKSEYWMIFDYPAADGALRFATSSDGLTWTTYPRYVLQPNSGAWDSALYRASLLYDDATDTLKIWYSAYQVNTWHIGYVATDYSEFLAALTAGKWMVGTRGSGASYAVVSGEMQLTSSNSLTGAAYIATNPHLYEFTNNFVLEYSRHDSSERYNDVSFGSGEIFDWTGAHRPTFSNGYINWIQTNTNAGYSRISNTTATTLQQNIAGPASGQWINHRIVYSSAGLWRWYADTGSGYALQGTGQTDITHLNDSKSLFFSKGGHLSGEFGGTSRISIVRVRRYASPEPTAAVA